jgi:ATP-dependent helicase/nuclease subunit B
VLFLASSHRTADIISRMSLPRVYTIPASAPFLTVLVERLLSGELIGGFRPADDPLALAGATLYLPTRRACRTARDAFLSALGDAAILPRIVPVGDIDEDEIAFSQAGSGGLAAAALDTDDALSGLERRLLLAQLVSAWARSEGVSATGGAPLVANTPAAAVHLADALARLIDDMTTRRVDWGRLDDLVPDNLDRYWEKTLAFLKIARDYWPARLQELGRIEAAERRDLLIAAEIARLQATTAPVIAAGSTGSMPATADLLAAIAKLPHGAVVLPGLDTELDDASWDRIAGMRRDGAGDAMFSGNMVSGDMVSSEMFSGDMPAVAHPQFAMHGLLKRIGILRRDVVLLAEPAPHGREPFVSQALRPTATTDRWRQWLMQPDAATQCAAALRDLTVIEAAGAEEEATAIAVALRETLETPGKTAALVTPDRALARRVIGALERWQIAVDDSGGDSLADAGAGIFARLVAEAALAGAEPVTLLALLKHPLLRLGRPAGACLRAVEALELAVLRGPRPRPGTAGLAHAFATLRATLQQPDGLHHTDMRHRLTQDECDDVAVLIEQLAAALQPLETMPRLPQPLAALVKNHYACLVALGGDDADGVAAFTGPDGRALVSLFDELRETPHADSLAVAPADYADLFHALIAERVVRKPSLPDVRVRIYGPLEARLQQVDRMILGGLVEGTWPPDTRTDPWLSRPMRHQLGLDLPERRIGLSAHDFTQALGAREVMLTSATKLGGAPTVTSRFMQRLAALAGEDDWAQALKRGADYLDWARALDRPMAPPQPIAQPSPRPARAQRPNRLSVTEIEDWLRDPYTIYARHILRLRPLDAVDTPPGAADRGTVIHAAVAKFTADFAAKLPDDPAAALIAIGADAFRTLEDFPEAKAFWWPRFLRIAQWFADWEKGRRDGGIVHPEIFGKLTIPRDGERPFTLTGRADRIEQRADGRYAILDYKTGRLPGHDEVKVGFAPQLPLEAAMLRGGGFDVIPAGVSVGEFVYIGLKGGQPPGEDKVVNLKDTTPDAVADDALQELTTLVACFDNDTQPYLSLTNPMWKGRRYGDYDHLARVKEWSVGGEETDE